MRNIVLCGLMGSGKSTVGRLLAQKLSMDFFDTDELIERSESKSISVIFKEFGEKKFREIESNIVQTVSQKNNCVISTGGGTVVKEDNLNTLNQTGTVFYLKADAMTLFERVKADTSRPLLQTEDPLVKLQNLLSERANFYEKADFTVDVTDKSPVEICDEIIQKYEKSS